MGGKEKADGLVIPVFPLIDASSDQQQRRAESKEEKEKEIRGAGTASASASATSTTSPTAPAAAALEQERPAAIELTGAGNAFCGAFLAAYVMSDGKCAIAGARAAVAARSVIRTCLAWVLVGFIF